MKYVFAVSISLLSLFMFVGCNPTPATLPTSTIPSLSDQLTIHYWAGGMPQQILDTFTAEYGVEINYVPFLTYADAEKNIASGQLLDVVFIGNDYIGQALNTGLLAELNLSNIPNLRNIAINFRDLTYDPGNRFSIPYTWGTTGLVFRSDLATYPITSWSDLWNVEIGKAGIWDDRRSMIGLTLRSLGYSANTSNPEELEEALHLLLELKPRAQFMEQFDPWTSAGELASGRINIALGWAYDALSGRNLNPAIQYIIPQEGTLLWVENMVIPANSSNQYTAEVFINFMLRPEISAQFTNETFYAVTNELASRFISEAIRNDPVVYPLNEMLVNAELIMPLSPEVKELYDGIWKRFMDAQVNS
jgi:spermidine/putrescine transport system substrate-binding protein